MTDFDAMSGQELAAEAARLYGWERTLVSGVSGWRRPDGSFCADYQLDPANDLSDCAKLGAAFLAAWPDLLISVFIDRDVVAEVHHRMEPARNMGFVARHPLEATARTLACIRAWRALNATKD